jgi:hypothetical protein
MTIGAEMDISILISIFKGDEKYNLKLILILNPQLAQLYMNLGFVLFYFLLELKVKKYFVSTIYHFFKERK